VIAFNNQLKENAIRQTQQDINQLTNLVFSLQNKIENLHHAETLSSNRIEELQVQLDQNHDAIAATREELEKCNSQLDDLADKLQAVEMDYASAEQEYNFANTTYNNSNLEFTKQQSKVTSIKQEFEFKSNQLSELTIQVESSTLQLNEASGNIENTATELKELETLLVTMLQNKETEEKKLNEADQEYYNIRNILTEKESELRHKQKSKEGIDHLLNEIKDRLTELKLQLAGMKERLSVEFKVDLDSIIDEPRTGETPLEELQEKNERMRKRLENMGEVNPTAIEAYTEMKKRYEFILEQKNDLVTAKDSLMQTIQEVEATANQQFLDTFNKTRENFQKVFKALFTEEDTADMILVDPENLAETGIEIVAKPKGKRPSSIGQLSGGEKTLTATALLFAIYLIKPAPFCILDEVDAPLDDANVGKFTNMIKQFSENSQFIIVTHNKMTMSAVDVIYGVTMQEAGVSKLVPVDFRSLN
jgi:chromosome segregation protein